MTNELYNGPQQYSQKSWDKSAGSTQSRFDILIRSLKRLIIRTQALFDGGYAQETGSVPKLFILNVWRYEWISPTKIGLILLWALILWWGELKVFQSSISSCQWEKWETWVGLDALILS